VGPQLPDFCQSDSEGFYMISRHWGHGRLRATVSMKGGKRERKTSKVLGPTSDKERGVVSKKKGGKVIKDGE